MIPLPTPVALGRLGVHMFHGQQAARDGNIGYSAAQVIVGLLLYGGALLFLLLLLLLPEVNYNLNTREAMTNTKTLVMYFSFLLLAQARRRLYVVRGGWAPGILSLWFSGCDHYNGILASGAFGAQASWACGSPDVSPGMESCTSGAFGAQASRV